GYIWCDGSEDTVEQAWTNASNLPSHVICSQRWRDCEMKVWYTPDDEDIDELNTLKEYKFNTLKDKLK
ncbi:hypothetical protein OEK97_28655, partial [Escherichia coli]|uniref:hypothetical protein n=1 Tax=Escherichia coli TaxID=562 RepID=UPI0021DB2EB5